MTCSVTKAPRNPLEYMSCMRAVRSATAPASLYEWTDAMQRVLAEQEHLGFVDCHTSYVFSKLRGWSRAAGVDRCVYHGSTAYPALNLNRI